MTYRHFNNESTRSSVIRAVANTENEVAWNRLFDLYAGFVYSIARSKGLKPEDADDIVQIVFADLARNLPKFQYDREKGHFRSYLTGLVNWRVMDRLKASKRDAELKAGFWEEALSAASAGGDNFAEREWQAAAMEEALRRMKPTVRPEHYAAFVASAVEDRTRMSSRSSTASPATTCTRSATGSWLNCTRMWRRFLTRWTLQTAESRLVLSDSQPSSVY